VFAPQRPLRDIHAQLGVRPAEDAWLDFRVRECHARLAYEARPAGAARRMSSGASALGIVTVSGESLPAAFKVVSLLRDVGGSEGVVVLSGDPARCAVLGDGVARGGLIAYPVLGPDAVGTEGQEVSAQRGRADRLPAAALYSLLGEVGRQLFVCGFGAALFLVLRPREVVAVDGGEVAFLVRFRGRGLLIGDRSVYPEALFPLRGLCSRNGGCLLGISPGRGGCWRFLFAGFMVRLVALRFTVAELALLEDRDEALQVLAGEGLAAGSGDAVPLEYVCREVGCVWVLAVLVRVREPGTVEEPVPRSSAAAGSVSPGAGWASAGEV
jgi:hypothetical protein